MRVSGVGIGCGVLCGVLGAGLACSEAEPIPARSDVIPTDVRKGTPDNDAFPPVVWIDEFEQPVPMPGPVNTAGAEDSPFFAPDGSYFLFFFTPDVRVPANQQLLDLVSGLWWAQKSGDTWAEPRRILLNDDVALDGCPFVLGTTLWFCSARVGNIRDVDLYTARLVDGEWRDWENAGRQVNGDYRVGEMHITADGATMYYHRPAELGGLGGSDLWRSAKAGDGWGAPENLGAPINTTGDEYLPFVSADGTELWFNRNSAKGKTGPAVWRSKKQGDGSWGEPEEIAANFAGEPNLDPQGNLYFVHHFFTAPTADQPDIRMIEADIYVARRK
jgi:hypothetical protein